VSDNLSHGHESKEVVADGGHQQDGRGGDVGGTPT